MAERALGIVLDDDTQRRIRFACQSNGAVVLQPEPHVETHTSAVFAYLHLPPPCAVVPPFLQAMADRILRGPNYPQTFAIDAQQRTWIRTRAREFGSGWETCDPKCTNRPGFHFGPMQI